jgi:hypothetical protein
MLTTRDLTETGFGYKNRDWNAEQFQTAYLKVTTSPEVVALGVLKQRDHSPFVSSRVCVWNYGFGRSTNHRQCRCQCISPINK